MSLHHTHAVAAVALGFSIFASWAQSSLFYSLGKYEHSVSEVGPQSLEGPWPRATFAIAAVGIAMGLLYLLLMVAVAMRQRLGGFHTAFAVFVGSIVVSLALGADVMQTFGSNEDVQVKTRRACGEDIEYVAGPLADWSYVTGTVGTWGAILTALVYLVHSIAHAQPACQTVSVTQVHVHQR